MNLQFTNKGGNFVSEFEVTSDFNLHIEGVRLSDMHIYQKTAGGSYAKVTDFPSERSQDRVADFDFASLVYPKFIKVVCATEPTYAEIATDGEVTEIKSQSKEVEITANGVTEIAPDNGFGYLSGVKVNVNVPQSGGGDVPSGGGSNIYVRFLIPENDGGSEVLGMCSGIPMGQIVCTYPDTQTLEYLPAVVIFAALFQSDGQGYDMLETTRAFSIISTDKVFIADKSLPIKTFDDFVDALIYLLSKTVGNIGRDMISQWFAEMTEEEFYNLEA